MLVLNDVLESKYIQYCVYSSILRHTHVNTKCKCEYYIYSPVTTGNLRTCKYRYCTVYAGIASADVHSSTSAGIISFAYYNTYTKFGTQTQHPLKPRHLLNFDKSVTILRTRPTHYTASTVYNILTNRY